VRRMTVPFWKGNVSELYSFNVTMVIVSTEWCGEERSREERRGEGQTDSMKM